ncbi:hypothetical protein [Streptomyces sp. Ac-502]|uniref:hypothetical protein n=1 Tax=Streptomyces sp. Ac-502 TaxID=3342801 RepID=UPI00386250DB
MEAAADRFGWRRAYGETTAVDALLAEQTETAYAQAAGHAALATAKNHDALAVRPGVLDARGRALADVLYLEGVLAGARNRRLAPELIARQRPRHPRQPPLLGAVARRRAARRRLPV